MINIKCLKSDLSRIVRDPILLIFLFLPFLLFFITKIMLIYLYPFVLSKWNIDLTEYSKYIFAIMILMTPNLLGTVFSFLMIDERDSNITDLMQITPMGTSGYIANRMILPFVMTIIYTFIGYKIMGIYNLNLLKLGVVSILLAFESVLFGITIFMLADDKVKALTYVKGINMVILLVLVDLTKINWLIAFAKIFPHYWVGRIITEPGELSMVILIVTVVVHCVWIGVYSHIIKKKGI